MRRRLSLFVLCTFANTLLAQHITRSIALTITYNLNPSRSKYKGTGAGNAEKSRL